MNLFFIIYLVLISAVYIIKFIKQEGVRDSDLTDLFFVLIGAILYIFYFAKFVK